MALLLKCLISGGQEPVEIYKIHQYSFLVQRKTTISLFIITTKKSEMLTVFSVQPFQLPQEMILTLHSTDTFCWGLIIKPAENLMTGPAGKSPPEFGPDIKQA